MEGLWAVSTFDEPPIFLYVYCWANKQNTMSTSKNKDNNNESKQNIQIMNSK
jgi:hypothetical protein